MSNFAFICLYCWDEQSIFNFSSHIFSHIYYLPLTCSITLNRFYLSPFLINKSPFSSTTGLHPFSLFLYLPPTCTIPLGSPNSLHCHPLILGCYAEMPATADSRLSPKAFALPLFASQTNSTVY